MSFYNKKVHRSDDPFSKAETKYLEDRKLFLQRTIRQFACMRRPQGDVRPKRLNWNVQPPANPFVRKGE